MLHVNDRHRSHGMWTDLKRNTKLIIIVVEMVSGYFALDVNWLVYIKLSRRACSCYAQWTDGLGKVFCEPERSFAKLRELCTVSAVWAIFHVCVSGVAVSMVAFQAVDPGSTPGWRTTIFILNIMLEKNIALSLIQVCFIACVNSTLTILLTYIRSVIHKVNIFEGNVVICTTRWMH